jgi:putative phosphoesterase
MKVAIISDIHDQVWNLDTALDYISEQAEVIICCGDLCSPFVLSQMAEEFEGPIHLVFGNNDGDTFRLTNLACKWEHVHLHGEAWFGELDGDQVAVNHYPEIARAFARSGVYDLVCYGHNHLHKVESVGHTLLINPGTLMGFQPGKWEEVPATFVIYDTESGAVKSFEVTEDEVKEYEGRGE